MIDRTALRQAYRPDENEVVGERLAQAKLGAAEQGEAAAIARTLVKAVRGHKAAGLDAFLQAYDLGSDEGIALMCLAEALLRIPDAETADDLIADKLSGPGLGREDGRQPLDLRQCRDLLAAADRQGAGGGQRQVGQLACGARPRRRPPRRAGDPHRGQPGDEDPRRASSCSAGPSTRR